MPSQRGVEETTQAPLFRDAAPLGFSAAAMHLTTKHTRIDPNWPRELEAAIAKSPALVALEQTRSSTGLTSQASPGVVD